MQSQEFLQRPKQLQNEKSVHSQSKVILVFRRCLLGIELNYSLATIWSKCRCFTLYG